MISTNEEPQREAEKQVRLGIAKEMLSSGELSYEKIAEYTSLPKETVQLLAVQMHLPFSQKNECQHCAAIEKMLEEVNREATCKVAVEMAKSILSTGNFTPEQIAGICDLSMEQVKDIIAQVQNST